MPFYPLHLEPFLLMGLVLLFGLITWKSLGSRPGPRKWFNLAVRALVLLLLVCALADLRLAERADRLSVIFLLDHSASVPIEERDRSLLRVQEALKTIQPGDKAGLVIFAQNASIESVPEEKPAFRKISSVVTADYTDIGGAIRLAAASFPEGTQRRLVLLSDGNENMGNAVDEARRAWASGVSIDVWPVTYSYESEVRIERVIVPAKVKKGETFEARIIVSSSRETRGKVFLTLNRTLVNVPRSARLTRGKNVLVHTLSLDKAGFYTFQARVEAEEDSLAGNNTGFGFTIVEGEPRILIMGGTENDTRFILEALKASNITAETGVAATAPLTPAGFQSFDCVILANVHARMFTPEQMNAIRASVVNFGMGLIMVGGDKSFGAGEYFQTPVEAALPVSCEVKQKRILPNGALVLVMHTCEFADGNVWAKKIARRAVNQLTDEDLVGLIFFDGQCEWLFELAKASDRPRLIKLIEDKMNPGDMPDFDSAIKMAIDALKNAEAAKKHIVIISDGDPQPPSQMRMIGLSKSSIAVSTVLINPHDGDINARKVMVELAEQTGGRFYKAERGMQLPGIITRVARTVSSSFIKEKPFTPIQTSASEILKGFESGIYPPLLGRVVTSAKPGAEIALRTPEGDPLLAHWRAGLGRTAAFTSDAKNRWGAQWISWEGFSKFWAQTVRWCMRTLRRNNFSLSSTIRGGEGRIVLDALDDEGRFINYLGVEAKVVTPSFRELPVRVTQKGPGRYEGTFPSDEVGAYYVSLLYDGRETGQGFMATGTALSYSPEFFELTANQLLLTTVAEAAQGRMLRPGDDVFLHNLPRLLGMEPQWPLLLLIAAALFFWDVFHRRVSIPFGPLAAGAGRMLSRALAMIRPAPDAKESSEAMSALLRKKSEIAEEREEGGISFEAPAPDAARVSLDDPEPESPLSPRAPAAPPPPAPDDGETMFTKRLLDAKRKAFKNKEKGNPS